MEGPTPVSALIHAATMVTAGVFMVARCAPIFSLSETAMNTVAIVGALTAVFAATIGLVQNDIKRVIAYSTISQLGYMFLALGVGAFSAGIFHLTTHAFFKGLLFLASGSVIHALSGEQDMRKMGALKSKIKITHVVFFIGTLALAGHLSLCGLFQQGRDPLERLQCLDTRPRTLGPRGSRRFHDGILFVPADLSHVLWQIANGPRSGTSRS